MVVYCLNMFWAKYPLLKSTLFSQRAWTQWEDAAYVQIFEEDGHQSLRAGISLGEDDTRHHRPTLVIADCGRNCHYIFMPKY